MAYRDERLPAKYPDYHNMANNAFAQQRARDQQLVTGEYYQGSASVPYPQPVFGRQQILPAQPEIRPIWFNPNNPPVGIEELQKPRGRPLTTWSFVDDLIQDQEALAVAAPTLQRDLHAPNRTAFRGPYTQAQRSFPAPAPLIVRRQGHLYNPQAEQTDVPRRRDKFDFLPFKRDRKINKPPGRQMALDEIRNANLKDPALERNHFAARMKNTQATPRPTSESSETMPMSRRTPSARYTAMNNQLTAPIPAHLSTNTARTNATAQSQYVQPIQNDALMLGNAPMIPTRDGNYAATGQPRTVHGQPVTSMMGQLDFYVPSPSNQSVVPSQSSSAPYRSPLPRIAENQTTSTTSDAVRASSPGATMLSPTAPIFEPPTRQTTPVAVMVPTPYSSQQPQFTVEQLITRVDRLALKLEENTQLLVHCLGRQTRDRKEIQELKKEVAEHGAVIAGAGLGGPPGVQNVSESQGEIGDGWFDAAADANGNHF